MKSIHIVLASDENYLQHAAVTMTSILVNKTSPNKIVVHFIDGGISSQNLALLEKCVTDYGGEFVPHRVDDGVFDDFYVSGHLSQAAYYRLAISTYLDSTVQKVIYFDTDMIIRHDIGELWETDIHDYYVGAVVDKLIVDKPDLVSHLGIPANEQYFNSGLLLINVSKWKEDQIGEKVINFIHSHEVLPFHDQDALNAVLYGKWLALHPKWNVTTFDQYCKFNRKKLLSPEILQAIRDPYIVHFTGPVKPWHFACAIPYTQDYYQYLQLTPWKNYRPTDFSLKSFGKRMEWKFKWAIGRMVVKS